jgi:methionyl-tRNA synthetase
MSLAELQREIAAIINRTKRPAKTLVTGGMPYANGLLHVGHLAGALVPPDVYCRWMKMLIGEENVLFVCGTDDHGSTSEVAARKAGVSVREYISGIHEKQEKTLARYSIGLDVYSGTSSDENYEDHKEYCQEFLRVLYKNGMLEKRTSKQWFDPAMSLFLADRYVMGTCPKCGHDRAYSEQCDSCGAQYNAEELINPLSTVSGDIPVLRDTDHWWLNMWKVLDQLKSWIETKEKSWRKLVYTEAIGQVAPCVVFSNTFEATYKELKVNLPAHRSRYAPGKRVVVQFENLADLQKGKPLLEARGVEVALLDGWAHRSITRDISWGIPVPEDVDPAMKGKTFYVWPESLIAPIPFTRLALKKKGINPERYADFWKNPEAKIAQFIGTDNIFFYVVMQGALWFGSQKDPLRMPIADELQLTDVYANCHLLINGEKMSKSTGNFYTADQLLDEYEFTPDQIRYYLSQLSLPKKQSNFDLEMLREKVAFLAGSLNAAFERPISAAHSKFDSRVPGGDLIGKTEEETRKIVEMYMKHMSRADYPDLLFLIENYARLINKLFTNYKPHDDRCPEGERRDALFSSFLVLKTLMIMLYPFVPTTMNRVRESLNLPMSVFSIDELGTPIPEGHVVGNLQEFFPYGEGGRS